jgi:hypothetical protein
VRTWDRGWAEARSELPRWLADCPDGFVSYNRWYLVVLFRRIRQEGELASLAEMLGAVADRRGWGPWVEAVGALAGGAGPEACKSDEARYLYEDLSSP